MQVNNNTFINHPGLAAYKAAQTRSSESPQPPRPAIGPDVQISSEARAALEEERKQNLSAMMERINSDPEYADKMALNYSRGIDLIMVDLKLGEKVGPNAYKMTDEQNEYFLSGQYKQERREIEQIARRALHDRKAIYADMKSQGASGKEIFYAIMDYNATLPEHYQQRTGLTSLVAAYKDTIQS